MSWEVFGVMIRFYWMYRVLVGLLEVSYIEKQREQVWQVSEWSRMRE